MLARSGRVEAQAQDRWRLYRTRRRDGVVVLRIPVDENALISAMLDAGLLDEEEALDRHVVERVLAERIGAWAGDWQKTRYT